VTNFIGEYDVKLDVKGRLSLPAGLLKQIPDAMKNKFIVNRSVFQKCLVLHTTESWEEIIKDLSKLNRFVKKNDDFIRIYTNGAVLVEVDSANRLLLPKRLAEYAGIDKDVIMFCSLNKIEIWDAKKYNDMNTNIDPDAFGALAEDVMGNLKNDNE